MVKQWTPKQSSSFSKLYGRLAELPNYGQIKDEVNRELFPYPNKPLPYKVAEGKLLELISKHSDLESIVNEAPKQKDGVGILNRILNGINDVFSTGYATGALATAALLYLL